MRSCFRRRFAASTKAYTGRLTAWLLALVSFLTAAWVAPLAAQTCAPATVTVSISHTAELGPPSGDATVCPYPLTPPQTCYTGWGSVVLTMAYPGTYQFRGSANGYLTSPYTGSVPCDYEQGCLVCHGSASITLYGASGNVVGTVIDLNSGPLVGAAVVTNPYPPTVYTNGAGYYSFGQLSVQGDGSGPGTGSNLIDLCCNTDYEVAVTYQSGQTKQVDFVLNAEQGRCEVPPPNVTAPNENVGKPVSVLTGNVWFDATDISMPGAGAGVVFTRSYNSKDGYNNHGGIFGRGWRHTYESRMSFPGTGSVVVREANGRPVFYQDWDGNLTYAASFPVTEKSWLVKSGTLYTRNFRDGSREEYDLSGLLMKKVDASGNQTLLAYDGQGRLISVTDPGSRQLTLAYDMNGLMTTLSGPAGTIATYDYDASNLLHQVTFPDGTGYMYDYDGSGQVVRVADLSGTVLETHAYSGSFGVSSELSDGRERYTVSYGTSQTTVTDALGNVTVYDWKRVAGLKRITRVTGPCSGCGGGSGDIQEWTYYDDGRIASYKDGAGNVTTYSYDANGNLASATDPQSHTESYTYDAEGRVLTATLPASGTTTYVQSASGPTSITQQVTTNTSRTTAITYTTEGKPHTITDPRSKTTTLDYNSLGDLTSVTDPLTHATTFAYDSLGRRTGVTDALNHTTTTTYDARGRVTRVTSHDGTHTDFGYDAGGRRTTVTDPLGRATTYAYDTYGRLAGVVDPLGGTTSYGYDLMSNLTSLTDANFHATTFEYDGHNRVKKVTYPGGAYDSFTYDSAGRLASRVDRKSVTTTYSYDTLSRLTGKTYSDGTPAVTYTYDDAGRLLTAGNGTDSLTWTFDLAGQLLTEASTKNSSTVAYTYDLAGNRLSISLDGGVFVTYAYDDASRLSTITRGSNVFGFGYDNANRRTSLNDPNGVNTTYVYDNLSRLTSLTAARSGTTITQWGYAYDNAGNRTQKSSPDYSEDYGYDTLSRLTDVNRTGAAGAKRWIYGYDPVGNRIREQIDSNVSTPAYNEKNQLLSSTVGGMLRFKGTLSEPGTVTVNGQPAHMLSGNTFEATVNSSAGANTIPVVATDGSGNSKTNNYQVTVAGTAATYGYDSNGNLTSKTEGGVPWTYEWNPANQLTRVLNNGSEVTRFKYDPLGRRVEKVAGSATTTWTYDGQDLLREISGATTLKYVHGPGIDEPLAQEDGAGALSYFQADGLGSIVKTTNAAGAILTSRRYDAFGNLELGVANGYSFTGREWDSETGFYAYRARYYDPKIGRFTSEDPARFRGDVNFYAYVRGNPVNFVDPLGLRASPRQPCPGVPMAQKAYAWVCCIGGKLGICYDPLTVSPKNNRCLMAHEEEHITREHARRDGKCGRGECDEPPCDMVANPNVSTVEYNREHCDIYFKEYYCVLTTPNTPPNFRNEVFWALTWCFQNNFFR